MKRLTTKQLKMIAIAKKKHGEIFPMPGRKTIEDGFCDLGGGMGTAFWYNCKKDSSHIVTEDEIK